jgi:hypothetical protein
MWSIAPNFANPSASTFTQLPDVAVAAFTQPCSRTCVPQLGTTQLLDVLSDRMMYRFAWRSFSDHASLVVNHSVTAGSSIGVRWYEIQSPLTTNGPYTVFQQGTFGPDPTYRWMGSAAMDKAGDISIGFSASSSSINPGIRYTGRVPSDPLGTLESEATIQFGTGSQTTNLNRWGDYSALRIDPADDCTFWYSTEYLQTNGTFNWNTHIGSFIFPGCNMPDYSLSANPASMTFNAGGGSSSTITVTAVGSYANTVNLSVSGCPANVTCTLNPGSVTPTAASTLTVTSAANAAPGTYPLTITGTDGTLTHTTSVSLTITVPDFKLSANPSSLIVYEGSASATSTVSVTALNGYAKSVGLTVAGCPANATCTLKPTSVTGSGTSTLTVSATTAVAAGSYMLTITGTDGTLTHSVTVPLTVNPPAPDFALKLYPAAISITRGSAGGGTIVLATKINASSTVKFSITGLPTGAYATFEPTQVPTPATSTCGIYVSSSTIPGTYKLRISGNNGTFTHNVLLTLTVK